MIEKPITIKNIKTPRILRIRRSTSVVFAIDHCRDFENQSQKFQKKWAKSCGNSIEFHMLHILRMLCDFYYYGSSINLGARFKYHFYITP